jgi:hypothetical protein
VVTFPRYLNHSEHPWLLARALGSYEGPAVWSVKKRLPNPGSHLPSDFALLRVRGDPISLVAELKRSPEAVPHRASAEHNC